MENFKISVIYYICSIEIDSISVPHIKGVNKLYLNFDMGGDAYYEELNMEFTRVRANRAH